jgi:DNA-directed RNA polymerase
MTLTVCDQATYEVALKEYKVDQLTEKLNKNMTNGTIAYTAKGISALKDMMLQLGDSIAIEMPAYFGTNNVHKRNLGAEVVTYLTTEDWVDRTKGGKDNYEPYQTKAYRFALVALSACLNAQYNKEGRNAFVAVAVDIGKALETEARIAAMRKAAPGLFNYAYDKYLKDPIFGAGAAMKMLQSTFNSCEVEVQVDWAGGTDNMKVYASVGAWLLAQVISADNALFASTMGSKGNPAKIVPTEYLTIDTSKELMGKGVNTRAPLAAAPKPWSNTTFGGYHCNGSVFKQPLVKKNTKAVLGQAPIDFINNLQSVAYKVNTFVVDVVNELKLDPKFAGLGSLELMPKEHELNAKQLVLLGRKVMQCEQALTWAEQIADQPYWLAWNFDWRGRAYPLTDLNTQSTDFGKSLVLFAEAGEVTEAAKQWLAIHLANTFGNGVEKAPLADRVVWANSEEVVPIVADVAANPAAWVKLWATDPEQVVPDEPWQFIAACKEYVDVVLNGATTTCLPVGADATCSGLQILAGLTKDSLTAAQVNVIGNAQRADAYTACIEVAKQHLPEEYHTMLSRSVAKKVVMTTPYNAGAYTNGTQVYEALGDLGIKVAKPVAGTIANALRDGLKTLMPKALQAMEWVSKEVYAHTKAHNLTTLEWTTPSGFAVKQECCVQDIKRVKVGGMNLTIALSVYDHSQANPAKHKSGTAPNLIHSLDASQLHLSFADFAVPFSCIHDCVLTRACDMPAAIEQLKSTYATMFSAEVFKQFATQVGLDTTTMPALGDLDTFAVMDSDYFFS